MKKMKTIPLNSDGKVGDCVSVQGVVYEKSKNGRWGRQITEAHLRDLYCKQQLTLREIAEALGVGHSLVQAKMKAYGIDTRSHYGRFEEQLEYMRKNAKALKKAHDQYDIGTYVLAKFLGLNIEAVVQFFTEELGYAKDKRRRVVRKTERTHSSYIRSELSYITWNKYLGMDVSAMSYTQYRAAIKLFTRLVAERTQLDKKRGAYDHIDHIFSVYNGYWRMLDDGGRLRRKEPVPLALICHPENLRVLDARANCAKGNSSDMSLKQLRSRVENSTFVVEPMNYEKDIRAVLNLLKLEIFDNGN
ncbi:hypothetical protein H1O16_gp171 [Burkholderia phage BcepSaruman]|uniref:Uncharacterized protein n=1 Tax=Burkholderia phage BcepSaruman TaxID=2530032 RepID=A0A4D5ZC97_9CAUD|nr:hypothetical protein H1O16_gp171 [Burkholderia phage BcepSaruman]QBX06584.1 hypothetical protein BcepSaruman_171 [Burkholderia phage BcepSaruman]